MRKNFAQVLAQAKVDIEKEYSRLYDLYSKSHAYYYYNDEIRHHPSFHDCVAENFQYFWFRGTCLTLDDFIKTYEFSFCETPENIDLVYLVSFCEYFYNLLICLKNLFSDDISELENKGIDTWILETQITDVIESIGYMKATENNLTIFVEKSPAAIAVSEILPDDLSYKVISYNHHSMKGKLDDKKDVILKLALLLEAQRAKLRKTNEELEADLFCLFNNLNIRHNNIEPSHNKNYREFVAHMSKTELEHWYDEVYQMCLLAFLELDHIERKIALDVIKEKLKCPKG